MAKNGAEVIVGRANERMILNGFELKCSAMEIEPILVGKGHGFSTGKILGSTLRVEFEFRTEEEQAQLKRLVQKLLESGARP